MLLFAVTALLFTVVNSPAELFVLRFLVGVAIGADMPTSFAIITEFVPKQNRGMLLAVGNGFWIGGAVVGGLISLAIFTVVPPVDAWRWILFSAIVPCIVVLALRRNVPETPRWLLAQGRDAESVKVLRETGHIGHASTDPSTPSVNHFISAARDLPGRSRRARREAANWPRRPRRECFPTR